LIFFLIFIHYFVQTSIPMSMLEFSTLNLTGRKTDLLGG